MKKLFFIFSTVFLLFDSNNSNASCDDNCIHRQDRKYIAKDVSCECGKKCDCKKKNDYEKYWVQYSENDSLFFRYLTTNLEDECPYVFVDDNKVLTFERVHPLKESFPMRICQAEFDNKKSHRIKFKDLDITTKLSDISKISIVGDAGCVIDKNFEQKCNIFEEFPFSAVAESIAKTNPDLIVHVGDYFYAKDQCKKTKECMGRPHGDRLSTWKFDFFNNAEPFLKSAPIVFVRGNHEKCSRGGNGWSAMIDYSREFRECADYTNPYVVELKKARFLVVDSAEAEDSMKKFMEHDRIYREKQFKTYIEQFNKLAKHVKNDKENILIVHRPVLSREIRPWDKELKKHDINYVLNHAIQNSDFKKVFPKIKIILSGHTHTAMLLELRNKGHDLYQIVSGNGGAVLNKAMMVEGRGKIYNYRIKDHEEYKGFGFAELFLKDDDVKKIKFYDYNGVMKFEKEMRVK